MGRVLRGGVTVRGAVLKREASLHGCSASAHAKTEGQGWLSKGRCQWGGAPSMSDAAMIVLPSLTVRCNGAVAAVLCRSCFYECGPHPWDVCAAAVIVREVVLRYACIWMWFHKILRTYASPILCPS